MSDATSTLIFKVATKAAVAEVAALQAALAELTKTAASANTAVSGAGAAKAVNSTSAAVAKATQHMDKLDSLTTTFSRNIGGVSYRIKVGLDGTAEAGKNFNKAWSAVLNDASVREVRFFSDREKAITQYNKAISDNMSRSSLARMQDRYQMQQQLEQAKQLTAQEKALKRVTGTRSSLANLNSKYALMSPSSQMRTLQHAQNLALQGQTTSQIARRVGSQALVDSRTPQTIQNLASALDKSNSASVRASHGMQGFGRMSRETHGFVRGLSGSLNQLWLTYGSLMPLLTGAALGSVARNTFQVGRDLEYRLRFVEALGNNPVQVEQLMPSVMGSMKTPLEAAEALQALAQAGLTTKQSLDALQSTMQLSTLGELGMTEAAVAMTGTISAYSMAAAEAGKVGDVFAKTAASSNTTVEQISISMRQASTAAAQYGISVEETSAALAVMAKRNITGSMAGTSYRNMLKELYTPIARGAKAMETLGLSAYTAEGQMKPLSQILKELDGRLTGLTEKSRNQALEAIFGERGGRAIRPILEDLDTYLDTIDELENSMGFLEEASMKLLNTTEGRVNIFQSTLQQSFAKAFEGVQDDVNDVIKELTNLVRSDGFISGIQTITQAFASLTSTIIDNKREIAILVSLWATARVGAMSFVSLQNIVNAVREQASKNRILEIKQTNELARAKAVETAQRLRNATSINAENAANRGGLGGRFPDAQRTAQASKALSAQTANTISNVGLAATAMSAFSSTASTAGKAVGLLTTVIGRVAPVISLVTLAYMGISTAMRMFAKEENESRKAWDKQLSYLDEYIGMLEDRNKRLREANLAPLSASFADVNAEKSQKEILEMQMQSLDFVEETLQKRLEENKTIYDQAKAIDDIHYRSEKTQLMREAGFRTDKEVRKVLEDQQTTLDHITEIQRVREEGSQRILDIETQIEGVMRRTASLSFHRAGSEYVGYLEGRAREQAKLKAEIQAAKEIGDTKRVNRLTPLLTPDKDWDRLSAEANATGMLVQFAHNKIIESGNEVAIAASESYIKDLENAFRLDQARSEREREKASESIDFGGSSPRPKTPRYRPTQDERAYDRIVRSANEMRLKTESHLGSAYREILEHQNDLLEDIQRKYMSDKDLYVLDYRNKVEDEYNKLIKDRQKKVEELEAVISEGAGGASEYSKSQVEDAKNQIQSLQENIDKIRSYRERASQLAAEFAGANYNHQYTYLSRMREQMATIQTEMDQTWYLVTDDMIGHWNSAADALAEFVATGKGNIKDFVASVLADLSKMAFKIAANRILMSVLGMIAGSSGPALPSGFTSIGGGWTSTGFAKGGAFGSRGQLTRFASGGAFTNTIARRAQVAPMAMFGEAGPEAIMPLTRMPGGDLGIKAIPTGAPDGASVNNVSINTTVVVNSDGSSSTTSTTQGETLYKELGDMITNQVRMTVAKETRQGGIIRRAIQER